jgi:hypothetical protein
MNRIASNRVSSLPNSILERHLLSAKLRFALTGSLVAADHRRMEKALSLATAAIDRRYNCIGNFAHA